MRLYTPSLSKLVKALFKLVKWQSRPVQQRGQGSQPGLLGDLCLADDGRWIEPVLCRHLQTADDCGSSGLGDDMLEERLSESVFILTNAEGSWASCSAPSLRKALHQFRAWSTLHRKRNSRNLHLHQATPNSQVGRLACSSRGTELACCATGSAVATPAPDLLKESFLIFLDSRVQGLTQFTRALYRLAPLPTCTFLARV